MRAGCGECPISNKGGRTGPRGCNFSGMSQQGDLSAAFNVGSYQ